jgi:hypothetical protein
MMPYRLEVLECESLPHAGVLAVRCRVAQGIALVGQAALVSNFFALGVSTKILGVELGLRGSSTVPTFGEITVLLPFDERAASLLRQSGAVIEGVAAQ